MGMPADKDIWLQFIYEFACPYVIPAGIATYMNHEYLEALTFKEAMNRMSIAEIIVVTVSSNAHKGLEGRDFLGGLESTTEIACMPHFVNRSKKFLELFAEHTMRVRYETYIFH